MKELDLWVGWTVRELIAIDHSLQEAPNTYRWKDGNHLQMEPQKYTETRCHCKRVQDKLLCF